MHKLKVDEAHALIEIQQSGLIKLEEIKELTTELRYAIDTLRGRRIKILVDTRFLHPVPEGVDEEMRAVQEYGTARGVEKVAQVVESSVVLLQRTRIMRAAGTELMTRIFRDLEEARRWLITGEEPESRR